MAGSELGGGRVPRRLRERADGADWQGLLRGSDVRELRRCSTPSRGARCRGPDRRTGAGPPSRSPGVLASPAIRRTGRTPRSSWRWRSGTRWRGSPASRMAATCSLTLRARRTERQGEPAGRAVLPRRRRVRGPIARSAPSGPRPCPPTGPRSRTTNPEGRSRRAPEQRRRRRRATKRLGPAAATRAVGPRAKADEVMPAPPGHPHGPTPGADPDGLLTEPRAWTRAD